ncbi:MAG TPA: hypothetical protein VMU01_13820 [Rhizomicrobium sp.]|nr:hypothetical protein [Rhizomicrobium sp.]
MPKRFTGIRLLLFFVVINLVMILMLVTSMTSAHPWLAHVLPGKFEAGVNSSGYWVFFALVLLVDALTVFVAGIAVMLPAMLEGAPVDERRLTRHLVDRGGVSDDAKEAIFVSLREEAVNTHYQVMVGRAILFAGAVFLVFAFFSVTYVFARAIPDGHMFMKSGTPLLQMVLDLSAANKTAAAADRSASERLKIGNADVRGREIAEFTADQVVAAVALNAPQIYGVQFSSVTNNPKFTFFTHFIFAFRTVLGFTLVLMIISFLRRPQRPLRQKKTIESVEAKLEEARA